MKRRILGIEDFLASRNTLDRDVIHVATCVLAETPVLANCKMCMRTHDTHLLAKYGEKAGHLDSAFMRYEVDGTIMVYLRPTTVYGALKRALGLYGKPARLPFQFLGIFFPEDSTTIITAAIVNASGDRTLVNYEAIMPGARGAVLARVPQQLLPKYRELIEGLELVIGPLRNKGHGVILVEKDTTTKIDAANIADAARVVAQMLRNGCTRR